MKRAAKIDDNQKRVVKLLRAQGCSVVSLAAVGKGMPDLLVGFGGTNYLVEVKNGSRFPSQRVLTADQKDFHARWRGSIFIIETDNDVLEFFRRIVLAQRP